MSISDCALASTLAEKFHFGQKYGKEDYMYHLRMVAQSVREQYDDRLEVIAWLHDIIEDTDCTEELIRQLFDKDIVDAVAAMTKKEGEPYEFYIGRVKANALALKVKLHDSKCNLEESMKRGDVKRIRKYAKQILDLVDL